MVARRQRRTKLTEVSEAAARLGAPREATEPERKFIVTTRVALSTATAVFEIRQQHEGAMSKAEHDRLLEVIITYITDGMNALALVDGYEWLRARSSVLADLEMFEIRRKVGRGKRKRTVPLAKWVDAQVKRRVAYVERLRGKKKR